MPDQPINAEVSGRIDAAARRMQHWAENETVHLLGHVPKSWEEDDPDWWIGLAEVALVEVCDLCGKPMEDDNFKDHGEPCWNCPTRHPGADPMDLWP